MKLWLAFWLTLFGLLGGCPTAEISSYQESPKPQDRVDPWVGKKVIPRIGGKIQGEMCVFRWSDFSMPLQVVAVKKNRLIVGGEDTKAWIAKKDVVEFTAALKYFERHLEDHPRDAQAWAMKGAIRAVNPEKYPQAIEDCERAIKEDRKCLLAYKIRGNCQFRLGRIEAARADYEAAIKIDPKYSPAYNNLANTWISTGDYEKAIELYEKAFEITPKAVYQLNAGVALMNTGQMTQSKAKIEKAIALDPRKSYGHYTLAYLMLEHFEESNETLKQAIRHLQTACELSDWKNPDYLIALATACERIGDPQAASKYRRMREDLRDDDDDAPG